MLGKKAEISNQTLGILLIAAISLSLLGTFISVTKVGQVPTIRLIGYAIEQNTSQAIVNLTVDQVLDINFTDASLDWGEGSVTPGAVNCTLNSDLGNDPAVNCTGFNNQINNPLVIENIGNQNVTLNLSFSNNAAAFIGGTSPAFEFAVGCMEPSACRNTTGNDGAAACGPDKLIDANMEPLGGWVGLGTNVLYADVNTTNGYIVCPNFGYEEATDKLGLIFNVVIPSDSFAGNLSTTVTATAYIIDCQLNGNCD